MADETYLIDIKVDSKQVKRASKDLLRLQKRTDMLRKSQNRLARQTVKSSSRVQNMNRQITVLGRSTQRVNNRTAIMNARFKESNRIRPFEGVGEQLRGMAGGIAGVAAAATVATVAVAGIFAGAVVSAKDFNVQSLLAFESLTGSSEKATMLMQKSREMADTYGQTIQSVTGQFKKLLAAQFSIDEAESFIKMGADLRAIGTDAEGVKRAILAITQIKAKGRLQADELLQLSEANVSQQLIFDELQKSLGVNNVNEVRKIMERGEIDSATAIDAIQKAILKKTGGKEAGEKGKLWADTAMEAMANRIKNSGFSLLSAIGEQSPKGFEQLGLIGEDIAAFFRQMDTGNLSDIFETAINAFGRLQKVGQAFITGFVEALGGESESLNMFFDVFKDPDVLQGFKDLGSGIASIVAQILKLGAVFASSVGAFNVLKTGLSETMLDIESAFNTFGFNIAQGVKNGILSGISGVINAASSIANAAKNQFKSVLGIASPSKVFEGFGSDVVEGFDRGVQTPAVKAASKGSGASASGGGAIGTTNNFNMGGITNNTEVNEAQNGADIAAQIEKTSMAMIGRAFESMAMQNGVAGAS